MIPLHKNLNEPLEQWYKDDEALYKAGGKDIGNRYMVNFHSNKIDSLKSAWKAAKKKARGHVDTAEKRDTVDLLD